MFDTKRLQKIQRELEPTTYSIRTIDGQRALYRTLDGGYCIEVTSPLYRSDRGYSSVYLWHGEVGDELVRAAHRVPLRAVDLERVGANFEQAAELHAKGAVRSPRNQQVVYPHL